MRGGERGRREREGGERERWSGGEGRGRTGYSILEMRYVEPCQPCVAQGNLLAAITAL